MNHKKQLARQRVRETVSGRKNKVQRLLTRYRKRSMSLRNRKASMDIVEERRKAVTVEVEKNVYRSEYVRHPCVSWVYLEL